MENPSISLGNGKWATKDGKLLGSVLNEENRYAAIPFDFSRASSGTSINKQGLVQLDYLGNELVVNGDFATDSDWTNNGSVLPYITISGGVLNSNNTIAGSWHTEYVSQSIAFVNTKNYLVTFRARNIGGSLTLRLTQGGNIITDKTLASDWATYTVTYTANADNGSIRLFNNGSVSQFELSNISVKEVLPNEARIDYSDDANGAMLLEPASTNLVTNSAFGVYATNHPASSPTTTAPDGSMTAITPVPDSIGGNRYEYDIASNAVATNSKVTYSWYSKRLSTPHNTGYVGDLYIKSLANLTQVGISKQIQSNINGFNRFEAVFNVTNGAASSKVRAYYGYSIGLGNMTVAYWGHQLEALPYATSLIPTTGGIATRTADLCNNGGAVTDFNSTEGVLYVEMAALTESNTSNAAISISDNTTSNRIFMNYSTTTNVIKLTSVVGNSVAAFKQYTLTDATSIQKIAFRWNGTTYSLFIDGDSKGDDDRSLSFPEGTLTTASFNRGSQAEHFYGKVKDLRVYKKALTDAELITLTTL